MSSVPVNYRFCLAIVSVFRKPLFDASNVFCRVPQNIVLSADEQQLAVNVLDGNILFRADGLRFFRVVKQLA